jgi:hypothetical protein
VPNFIDEFRRFSWEAGFFGDFPLKFWVHNAASNSAGNPLPDIE